MFAEFLDRVVDKVEGTLGAAVIGMDGISIEKRTVDPTLSMETLAAEYASVLRSSSLTTSDLGFGALQEFVISTDQRIMAIRMITPEYFAFILLHKDGNLGRARFELRKAQLSLARELVV
jgi:predicted regulator of Ras-like GTPase activity (Roadblock/LC7/MglB family)